jgi:hypothetical protein
VDLNDFLKTQTRPQGQWGLFKRLEAEAAAAPKTPEPAQPQPTQSEPTQPQPQAPDPQVQAIRDHLQAAKPWPSATLTVQVEMFDADHIEHIYRHKDSGLGHKEYLEKLRRLIKKHAGGKYMGYRVRILNESSGRATTMSKIMACNSVQDVTKSLFQSISDQKAAEIILNLNLDNL